MRPQFPRGSYMKPAILPIKEQPRSLPRLLSVKIAALELDVSTKTVRRWIGAGLIPYHRVGRQIRIAEHDLRAFLASVRNAAA